MLKAWLLETRGLRPWEVDRLPLRLIKYLYFKDEASRKRSEVLNAGHDQGGVAYRERRGFSRRWR